MPHLTPSHRLFLTLCCSTLLLAGCTTLEQPEVFVTNLVPLESAGMLEQRLRVDLRVLNPNQVELPVSGLDLRLDVNGARLARGVSNETFVVPGLGETTTSITVSTSVFDLLRQLYVFVNEGASEVAYTVDGRAYLDRPMSRTVQGWPGRIGFQRDDVLRLPETWRAWPELAPSRVQPMIPMLNGG